MSTEANRQAMSTDVEKRHRTEKVLRKEVHHLQNASIRILQINLTVMLGFQTALFFIRATVTDQMIKRHELQDGGVLPLKRYILGTVMQIILAVIFARLSYIVSTRLGHYRGQLVKMNRPSAIEELPRFPDTRLLFIFIYFLFPVLDLIYRVAISIQ